jgi:acetyltransferase-like isoleucine patch superfamily enzyme
MFKRQCGILFYYCHNNCQRLITRLFSYLIRGAFFEYGSNSVIVPPVRLTRLGRIKIGDNVYIGRNSWLQTIPEENNSSVAIKIDNGVSIVGSCTISAVRSVIIEEDVLMAENVYISDHMHSYTDKAKPIICQGITKIEPVIIRRGSWIGQNVVICPGVTVGRGAVVGANSLVNSDVPDYCVVAGTPARMIKLINENMQGRV